MSEKKNILVVDDEEDTFILLEVIYADQHDLHWAKDGKAGLEKVKELKPDLVILDVEMPKMNGFEVFYAMREDPATKEIPVIMLTGIRQKTGVGYTKEDMGDFLGVEPDAYCEKPVEPEALQETINGFLNP